MKPIQRDGVDYEFTIVLEIDIKHNTIASKDRTELFMGKPDFKITSETGRKILEWCNSGVVQEITVPTYNLELLIAECRDIEELRQLYYSVPKSEQLQFRSQFDQRKEELNPTVPVINYSFNQHHINSNGNNHSNGTTSW